MDDGSAEVNRLVDEMLATQSRFAAARQYDTPLTEQQRQDAAQRDEARSMLLSLMKSGNEREDRLRAELLASAEHHATSAAQFTFYAQQHRAKSPPDVVKAETNEREADRCMDAAVKDRQAVNDE